MEQRDWLADRFEDNRSHLRGVAYRMLGSLSEADDAVQEAWLRLSRADASEVENLSGWLTTVVARISLDMLRSRKSRREEAIDTPAAARLASRSHGANPEQEAVLADSVGLAMLVVLETLTPAERLAFVLHDMFAMPYDEIAPIVDRSPAAARQLASRARRRVHGIEERDAAAMAPEADRARQREVVDAFLAAARGGDFEALLTVLDPDVVLRSDRTLVPRETVVELRGAETVASQAMLGGARAARPALVNGKPGVVVAPRGRLFLAIDFTVEDDRIVAMDAIFDPERLAAMTIAVSEEQ